MVDYEFNPPGIGNYNTTIYSEVYLYNCTNSSDSLISKVPIVIPFVPFGLGIIFVTTFGIFGNILSALVLTRRRLRSSYSVLTLGLLVADTVYLLTKLIRYGLDSLFFYYEIFPFYTNVFLPTFGPYLRPITFTAHTASTYFTIAIAFDRYIALSRPSKARRYCTTKQARTISFLVVMFAILYNALRWLEVHKSSCVESSGDIKHYMKISDLRNSPDYNLYYIFWAYLIVMFVFPFISLSVLNILIWKIITSIKRCGVTLSYTQSRETSFSAMLVGIVVVFLICNLDYLILDILGYFNIPFSGFWNYLGNFLLTFNAGVNFLIYCVCGKKFREEFKDLFHKIFFCCFKGKTTATYDITSDAWMKEQSHQEGNNLQNITREK